MLFASLNGAPPQPVSNHQTAAPPMHASTNNIVARAQAQATTAPVDASGNVRGTINPMARAQAAMAHVQAMQQASSGTVGPTPYPASTPPSPAAMAPGAYQTAVRTTVAPWQAGLPVQWRPDAVYDTGVIRPFDVRQRNPVTMARHTIDPFIFGVRAPGPGISPWPGPWPVYRQYTPMPQTAAPAAPGGLGWTWPWRRR